MVTSWAAIRQGFALARRVRSAVWVLFLGNLGLAALAAFPIYQGIVDFTGHSLMAETLTTGFSVNWFTDFAVNNPGAFVRYAEVIELLGLITLPVNAILAAGVLARFRNPREPFSMGLFFRDCGRYAWRMIRLMVIALFCYWVVFRFVNGEFNKMVSRSTRYWMDDRAAFFAHLGVGLLVLLALALVNLVIDFARVRLVRIEGAGVLESFLASLGFSVGRFPKAALVYAVPSLGGIALLGVYRLVVPWHIIHTAIGNPTQDPYRAPLVIALLFIGQQLIMFGRYWFRVATWGGEWALYSGSLASAPASAAESNSGPQAGSQPS